MPRFVQLNGSHAGKSHSVDEGTVLGRDVNCELTLKDSSISRRHARLIFHEGNWKLVDMGSRNGVFHDGRKMQTIVLTGGEEIRIGKLNLRFHLDRGEDWERKEATKLQSSSGDALTSIIFKSEDAVEAPKFEAPIKSVAERRANRIAEMQGDSDGGWLGDDLLQRSVWVRWLIYSLVVALAIGACVGAFLLAQELRS